MTEERVEQFMTMVGWYDDASDVAAHDPIPNNQGYFSIPSPSDVEKCLCMLCEQPLKGGPIRSVSIRWATNFVRSYFYRAHVSCIVGREDEASDKAWNLIEEHAMEKGAAA